MESKVRIANFSCDVSSACACYIELAQHSDMKIVYIHVEDQHSDTMRFLNECENWYQELLNTGDQVIEIRQSEYKTVENACRAFGYINGVRGAKCTGVLKRRVRKEMERELNLLPSQIIYVWGLDWDEQGRADRLVDVTMKEYKHSFPLIRSNIDKKYAHRMLEKAYIKRPKMYDLGYSNNNCVGCVKGGKGYWNHIRVDFPKVFANRAKMERDIGASCINGTYLDELDPLSGRHKPPIVPDCGIFCEQDLSNLLDNPLKIKSIGEE